MLQAQAWAAAERSLTSRLRDAEANAAAAAAREAAAEDALGALQVCGWVGGGYIAASSMARCT